MDHAEFAALADRVREQAAKDELAGFLREYNELQWKYGHADFRDAPEGPG